jgi:hypothetical protein
MRFQEKLQMWVVRTQTVYMTYIVVVAVKKRNSNCNVNEKEVIKIVVKYKRSKYTCSD